MYLNVLMFAWGRSNIDLSEGFSYIEVSAKRSS